MVWYCLCLEGTHLREQKHEEGAKRTKVVMLQVSMYVSQIRNFQKHNKQRIYNWVNFTLSNCIFESIEYIRQCSYAQISGIVHESMEDITCLHSVLLTHQMCKSIGTTRMTRLLVQQLKILAESMCKSMFCVENECIIIESKYMYEAIQWREITTAGDEETSSACLWMCTGQFYSILTEFKSKFIIALQSNVMPLLHKHE